MKKILLFFAILATIKTYAQADTICNCKTVDKKNSITISGTLKLTQNLIFNTGVKQTYAANLKFANDGNCAATINNVKIGNGQLLPKLKVASTYVSPNYNAELKITKKLTISNDGEDNWANATIIFKINGKTCTQQQKIKIIE